MYCRSAPFARRARLPPLQGRGAASADRPIAALAAVKPVDESIGPCQHCRALLGDADLSETLAESLNKLWLLVLLPTPQLRLLERIRIYSLARSGFERVEKWYVTLQMGSELRKLAVNCSSRSCCSTAN